MGYVVTFVTLLCALTFASAVDEKIMNPDQATSRLEGEDNTSRLTNNDSGSLKHLLKRINAETKSWIMDLIDPMNVPLDSVDDERSLQASRPDEMQSLGEGESTSRVGWRHSPEQRYPSRDFEPRVQVDTSPAAASSFPVDTRESANQEKSRMDKRMLGLFAHATLRSEPSFGMNNRKLTTRLSTSPTSGANGPFPRTHGLIRNSMPRLRWG